MTLCVILCASIESEEEFYERHDKYPGWPH